MKKFPCRGRADLNAFPSRSVGSGAFIMITILPFVGQQQHPSIPPSQHPGDVVVCSLFSSRIIDVGGRFVAAFLGRPQHTHHTHTHLDAVEECSLCVLHLFIFLQPPPETLEF